MRRLERGYLRVGYVAATLGLASGMAWAFGYFGSPLSPDPKEVSVVLGWLLLTLYFLLDERLRGSRQCLACASDSARFIGDAPAAARARSAGATWRARSRR